MLTAGCGLHASPIESEQNPCAGEMAERLKAHAWKACIRETVSGVRIPLSPPLLSLSRAYVPVIPILIPIRGSPHAQPRSQPYQTNPDCARLSLLPGRTF